MARWGWTHDLLSHPDPSPVKYLSHSVILKSLDSMAVKDSDHSACVVSQQQLCCAGTDVFCLFTHRPVCLLSSSSSHEFPVFMCIHSIPVFDFTPTPHDNWVNRRRTVSHCSCILDWSHANNELILFFIYSYEKKEIKQRLICSVSACVCPF